MPRVFISYRRDDSAGHAGRLYDYLRARFGDDSVFMDVEGIDGGEDFASAIDHAVGSSDILLAIIGRQWVSCTDKDGARRLDNPADFVRLEIKTALQRQIRVVPVLVEGAAVPSGAVLPEELRPLAARQAVELRDGRWQSDADDLIASLGEVGGAGVPRRRRLVGAVLGGLGLLVAFVVGLRLVSNVSPEAIAGEWEATVAYNWGGTYSERFNFTVDEDEVLGTASFFEAPRTIIDGKVVGEKLSFVTHGRVLGHDEVLIVRHYRGKISERAIEFHYFTVGGSSDDPPIAFTARRVGSSTED